MAEGRSNGADIHAKIAGQEINVKNVKSLNTILTTFSLIGVILTTVLLFQHQVDAREGAKAIVEAIKDNTKSQRESVAAQREANCLARLTPDQKKDHEQVGFCRKLGREP